MPLEKQSLQLNFSQGLDTITDPYQVKAGKFLTLENVSFDKIGRFGKRNGYRNLPLLPDTSFTDVNTYAGNLIAVGNSFQFFNDETNTWVNKGLFQPLDVQVTPMVRNSSDQVSCDTAVAPNNLALTVYSNLLPASPSAPFYQVVDSLTGHIVVPAVALPAGAGAQLACFVLGNNFIVTYPRGTDLKYIAIPWANPLAPLAEATLVASIFMPSFSVYDCTIHNNTLYAAAKSSTNVDIKYQILNSNLTLGASATSTVATPFGISITGDAVNNKVWVSWWDEVTTIVHSVCFNADLSVLLGRRSLTAAIPTGVNQVSGAANAGLFTVFYRVTGTTNTAGVNKVTITQGDVIGPITTPFPRAGIAAKAFYFAPTNNVYFLGAVGPTDQRVYLLTDQFGNIVAELAYQNAGQEVILNLPNVYIEGSQVQMGYLRTTQIQPVNRGQGATGSGVYTQSGVDLATFTFSNRNLIFNEIAGDHHFTGGFLWMYDGVKPVEHGFFQYPAGITFAIGAVGGMIPQLYYYYVTYEWTDAVGNIHRSAPSIPIAVTTVAAGSTVTLTIPTLRHTYKTGQNPVRIVVYRWSVAQPIPYQITSITNPVLNDPTVNTINVADNRSDAQIIGNLILYTTGGVVEHIIAPACSASTLFKSRMFLVDAEDRNLLWFSKQVIENVPVEFSDLFTIYVPPTIGALGNTGPIITISAMDDKLIIFKRNAIYYITGNGPDNTGANNDFSDPIFITATVGCTNLKSVVLTPIGLIFQSDKGIWLLGRDLQTQYIGAPVDDFNDMNVVAAQTILGDTQIRLTLESSNGLTRTTLVYDYFYAQWFVFTNIAGISTTIYGALYTSLSADKRTVIQENPGVYLDNLTPVNMRFTTAWINLAGLQGFERAYFFYLLATYLSPHTLTVGVAFDYDPAIVQTTTITPTNLGTSNAVEQWRVFFERQKCEAFQLTVTETYDASKGLPAGAGLTLSGLDLVVGLKKGGYPRIPAKNYAG